MPSAAVRDRLLIGPEVPAMPLPVESRGSATRSGGVLRPADFDDAAAYSAATESPEGQATRADVPNYATGGVVVLNYELRSG